MSKYFDADSRNDRNALSTTFAADAVVEDEEARHEGAAEIQGWWVAAKKAAQYVAEPSEAAINGDKTLVRAKVSGEFPGSPASLTYAFTTKDGKIETLEIH